MNGHGGHESSAESGGSLIVCQVPQMEVEVGPNTPDDVFDP